MEAQMAEAFRLIPYGIYALTAGQGAKLCTMIVSWVSQVSYAPPLLMVALRRNRPAIPVIRESGKFSLSLLSIGQKPLVAMMKSPAAQPRLSGLFSEISQPGGPLLKEALAWWKCRLSSTAEAGDHILFIGEVQSASSLPGGRPLTTADYGKTYIGQS